MTERIKLTEKRLKLDSQRGWQLSYSEIYQILSDQAKADNYDYLLKHGGLVKKKIDLLEQENKQLKEQLVGVRDINNDLYAKHYNLKQKLGQIEKSAFHAGCNGNPNCVLCPIMKILNESKQ